METNHKYLLVQMPVYRQEIFKVGSSLYGENTFISQHDEKWIISLDTRDRELTEISISLPNGKTWTGTIQCFMSIFDIMRNARESLMDDNPPHEDAIAELENAIDHLK